MPSVVVATAPLFSLFYALSQAWRAQDRNTPKQIKLTDPTSDMMKALEFLGLAITRLGPVTPRRVK